MLATEALKQYVDLLGFGMPEKARRREFRRMCDHFAFKTGAYAYMEWEDDQSEARRAVSRASASTGGGRASTRTRASTTSG